MPNWAKNANRSDAVNRDRQFDDCDLWASNDVLNERRRRPSDRCTTTLVAYGTVAKNTELSWRNPASVRRRSTPIRRRLGFCLSKVRHQFLNQKITD